MLRLYRGFDNSEFGDDYRYRRFQRMLRIYRRFDNFEFSDVYW